MNQLLVRSARIAAVLAVLVLILGQADGTFAKRPVGDVAVDQPAIVTDSGSTVPGASVTFNLHACPVNFDTTIQDIYQIAAACNTTGPLTTFHLYSDQGDQPATFDWLHTWSSIPNSKFVIQQEIPATQKQPFAYCSLDDGAFYRAPVGNGELVVQLTNDQALYCDWYVTPKLRRPLDDVAAPLDGVLVAGDGGSPTQPAGPQAGMSAFVCSTLWLDGDESHGKLASTCWPVWGAGFTAYAAWQTIPLGRSDDSGSAGLFALPTGQVIIALTNDPFGDARPVVYCRSSIVGNGYIADGADLLVDATGNQIQRELVAGETLGCQWYLLVDGPLAGFTAPDATPVADGPVVESDAAVEAVATPEAVQGDGADVVVEDARVDVTDENVIEPDGGDVEPVRIVSRGDDE